MPAWICENEPGGLGETESVTSLEEDDCCPSLEYDEECSTSSLGDEPIVHHRIVDASVSGFGPVKSSQKNKAKLTGDGSETTVITDEKHSKNEFVFIVEVQWSDGRKSVVKRTYSDFCNFHCYLLDEFARIAESESSSEGMRMNLYLPLADDGPESDIVEAESRELQLNKYVQDLVKLPEKLSASPTVLTFFESRNTDPKPYKEVEAMDMAQHNKTDHYVICWIGD